MFTMPSHTNSKTSPPFSLLRPLPLFTTAAILRLTLLLYGAWQDANTPIKYTDIDYYVFTDAARLPTPYTRETYRYTPLLAWLLLPTASHRALFPLGKLMFALADLLAGWLIHQLLLRRLSKTSSIERVGAFSAIWLWNPMVATISTRGSSEALLGVLTVGLLWAVESRSMDLAGLLLGLGVHFKIYPFIYAPAIVWWMDDEHLGGPVAPSPRTLMGKAVNFVSMARIRLAIISLVTFMGLNVLMYSIYGYEFLEHTFFHHVTRIDHRHNFSPYNTLLYLTSAVPSQTLLKTESLAFLPQLLLSCVFIPLVIAKKDLATSMMAQTFAFVTFNKVCTSQYFLWYMVFLPLYLPSSSFLQNPCLGVSALLLWIVTQAAWLHQGYMLEFLGVSTFFPGLWLASLAFFLTNCWILGIIISDRAGSFKMTTSSDVKAHAE